MADTKRGREDQAKTAEKRQRERELSEYRQRADEAEPPEEAGDAAEAVQESDDEQRGSRTCHRRGCETPAAFVVLERYQEETGHGAVEARADLCREHAAEEGPANLEASYEDYVFRVEPISTGTDEA